MSYITAPYPCVKYHLDVLSSGAVLSRVPVLVRAWLGLALSAWRAGAGRAGAGVCWLAAVRASSPRGARA